jgi:hypothetical protein
MIGSLLRLGLVPVYIAIAAVVLVLLAAIFVRLADGLPTRSQPWIAPSAGEACDRAEDGPAGVDPVAARAPLSPR